MWLTATITAFTAIEINTSNKPSCPVSKHPFYIKIHTSHRHTSHRYTSHRHTSHRPLCNLLTCLNHYTALPLNPENNNCFVWP